MPTRGLRGAYARLRGGTRTNPRNHLSYSCKFICITSCTYSGNSIYIYICINKLVDNLHIPSHLENANEHLPTRLAYAKKSRLPSRVPTHAYADCEISGQQPTQLYKEFPRVHEVGHSKKTLLNWIRTSFRILR